jgi:hypothetical protein
MSKHFFYALAPDGTMGLRSSAGHTYTYAMAVHFADHEDNRKQGWHVLSYHHNYPAAEKAASAYRREGARIVDVAVVQTHEVTGSEFARIKTGKATSALLERIHAQRVALRENTSNQEGNVSNDTSSKQTAGTVVVQHEGTDVTLTIGETVACYDHDESIVRGVLKAVDVEEKGDTVLTLWDGDRHRYMSVSRMLGAGASKPAQRKRSTAAAEPVDVHDFVRGDRQRCSTCGGARNIKAHTHIANKGA